MKKMILIAALTLVLTAGVFINFRSDRDSYNSGSGDNH